MNITPVKGDPRDWLWVLADFTKNPCDAKMIRDGAREIDRLRQENACLKFACCKSPAELTAVELGATIMVNALVAASIAG